MAAEDLAREEHVGFALRLAYQRASANLAAAIAPWEVTPVQFQTLLQLGRAGPTTQNQLGRSVGMPPANIHRIVRALIAAELVAVSSTADDKRIALVKLTRHGRRTLREMLPAADTANALTLSALNPSDQATLTESLMQLANGPTRARAPQLISDGDGRPASSGGGGEIDGGGEIELGPRAKVRPRAVQPQRVRPRTDD